MAVILAADIGGTHSRFAAFTADSGRLALTGVVRFRTANTRSVRELFHQTAASSLGLSPEDAAVTVLAVPGPVQHGTFAHLANVPWDIDLTGLPEYRLGCMFLVNDFVAQGLGCVTEAAAEAVPVKSGQAEDDGPVAVLGAGTGLGHCTLLPDGAGAYRALASEAGHAAFAFRLNEELDYARYLLAKTDAPYAYGDIVLSGRGLRYLHEFLTGKKMTPEEVGDTIGPDSETTAWFARFYARAARNYALTVVARGGLFVTGGVAAKNAYLVDNEHFRQEFLDSPKYRNLLEAMPVRLNRNEDAGLWGAASYGARMLGGAGGAVP